MVDLDSLIADRTREPADELREACAEVTADHLREQLADLPAEVREAAVRLVLEHPSAAAYIQAGALRLAGRLKDHDD